VFKDDKENIQERWSERMHVWQSSIKYREIDHKHMNEIITSAIKNMEKIKEVRVT